MRIVEILFAAFLTCCIVSPSHTPTNTVNPKPITYYHLTIYGFDEIEKNIVNKNIHQLANCFPIELYNIKIF